jgi:hypothetical protein
VVVAPWANHRRGLRGDGLVLVYPERTALRIIPHRSVLNSSNRKLWRVLHDVMAIGGELSVFEATYTMPPDIWWIVTLGRDARFYVSLPKEYRDVFGLKLRNHDQWMRSTVTEEEPQIVGGDLYTLDLERSDMFALTCDYTRQTTPIRDLLQVLNELEEGDSATLMIRLEAVSRRWWQARGDFLWDVWQKGDVPQRPGVSLGLMRRGLTRVLGGAVMHGQAMAVNVIEGIEQAVFSGHHDKLPERIELLDPERQALLVNGTLSTNTTGKRNQPVYRTDIYLLVKAPSDERSRMLAHSVVSAFGELAGDNRLTLHRNSGRIVTSVTLFHAPPLEIGPNLLSVDEVGRLIQLPTADVQEEFADRLEVNRKTEIEIPDVFLDESGIFAGTATLKGQTFNVHIPAKDHDMLMTARAFFGSPRMGKDQAAVNLIVESCLKGIGSVIPDAIDERMGHRGMADAVRDHLPPEKIIDINLGDFDWPVGLSLDGITASGNERILANRIARELVGYFIGQDIENYQTAEFLREMAKAVRGDLIGIRRMFLDRDYRAGVIGELRTKGRDTMLLEEYHAMTEARQMQIAAPVMVRLGKILGDEALRPIFCQPSRLELGRWMDEGKVVIFRIPSRDLGEEAVKALMHWLTLVVFLTKISRGSGGTPTWLVLNEPHQYLSDGFIHFCRRLLVEGPKYHIAPVLMFHNFKLLPDAFVDILLSSSLSWHIFKNTNDSQYERLKNYLAPTFEPKDAMAATPAYSFIASWLAPNGEYQPAFLCDAPSLVGKRHATRDNRHLTAEHSRKYGRPIDEVEKAIRQGGWARQGEAKPRRG